MSDYVFRNVRIHATDADSSFAAQVTSGIFPDQEVKRVPPEIFQKYFRPASRPGFVEVVPELRAKVTFSQHDLLSLRPVREALSLIVCKNVLLHLDEAERIKVLRMLHEALQPGGSLVMEHTQKLPDMLAPFFQQVAPYAQVYRKVERSLMERQTGTTIPYRHGGRGVEAPRGGASPHLGKSRQRRVRG